MRNEDRKKNRQTRGEDRTKTGHSTLETWESPFSPWVQQQFTCLHPQPLGDVALLQRRLGGGGERGQKDRGAPPRGACSGSRRGKNPPVAQRPDGRSSGWPPGEERGRCRGGGPAGTGGGQQGFDGCGRGRGGEPGRGRRGVLGRRQR